MNQTSLVIIIIKRLIENLSINQAIIVIKDLSKIHYLSLKHSNQEPKMNID